MAPDMLRSNAVCKAFRHFPLNETGRFASFGSNNRTLSYDFCMFLYRMLELGGNNRGPKNDLKSIAATEALPKLWLEQRSSDSGNGRPLWCQVPFPAWMVLQVVC